MGGPTRVGEAEGLFAKGEPVPRGDEETETSSDEDRIGGFYVGTSTASQPICGVTWPVTA